MKKLQNAVTAENAVLDSFGCKISQSTHLFCDSVPKIDVLEHPSGWKFHSFHRHILQEQERIELAAELRRNIDKLFPTAIDKSKSYEKSDDLEVNEYKLHIPPMLFGVDLMYLQFGEHDGVLVSARDALLCWAAKHTSEVQQEHALVVPKVPYAHKWQQRIAEGFKDLPPNAISPNSLPIHTTTAADVSPRSAHSVSDPPLIAEIKSSDWTYSTDYCFTLINQAIQSKQIIHANTLAHSPEYKITSEQTVFHGTKGHHWVVEKASQSGIDMEMLKRRDLPILFYDEIVLYEDDLEDCGEVSMDAKLRVMPLGWFILVKHFLRIDNVIVTSMETRIFHAFDQIHHSKPIVHVEVVCREKSLYGMSPSVDAVPSFASHVTSQRTQYNKNTTQNLPTVNEEKGIHQFYTIKLT